MEFLEVPYNQSYFLAKKLKETFECKTVATVNFSNWSQTLFGNIELLHSLKSIPENQRKAFEKLLLTTDEYDRNALRAKWRMSENEKVILFAGRLHPVKGLVFLISAFRKLLDINPNCRLIIAGSGNYDIYIQAAKDICTKVSFTGLIGQNELCELYQIADIGVIPSLYEPFGLVALEMMIHRLPIVATATSGLNEVVDENCGHKAPINQCPDKVEIDPDLLAEKILYLLQYPEEARKMGENGRKRYEKLYTTDVYRKNMMGFYQSLFEQ